MTVRELEALGLVVDWKLEHVRASRRLENKNGTLASMNKDRKWLTKGEKEARQLEIVDQPKIPPFERPEKEEKMTTEQNPEYKRPEERKPKDLKRWMQEQSEIYAPLTTGGGAFVPDRTMGPDAVAGQTGANLSIVSEMAEDAITPRPGDLGRVEPRPEKTEAEKELAKKKRRKTARRLGIAGLFTAVGTVAALKADELISFVRGDSAPEPDGDRDNPPAESVAIDRPDSGIEDHSTDGGVAVPVTDEAPPAPDDLPDTPASDPTPTVPEQADDQPTEDAPVEAPDWATQAAQEGGLTDAIADMTWNEGYQAYVEKNADGEVVAWLDLETGRDVRKMDEVTLDDGTVFIFGEDFNENDDQFWTLNADKLGPSLGKADISRSARVHLVGYIEGVRDELGAKLPKVNHIIFTNGPDGFDPTVFQGSYNVLENGGFYPLYETAETKAANLSIALAVGFEGKGDAGVLRHLGIVGAAEDPRFYHSNYLLDSLLQYINHFPNPGFTREQMLDLNRGSDYYVNKFIQSKPDYFVLPR